MTEGRHSVKRIILFIAISFLFSRILMYLIYGIKLSDYSLIGFITNMNVWDAGWYYGYVHVLCDGTFFQTINPDNGQAIWGFFPAYPLLLAGIWRLFGSTLNVYVLGSIVSSICFMLSEFIAYLYIRQSRDDDRIAIYYILFMSFGPYSFYYSSTYTEGLFLLLVVSFLYCMRKEQYLLMGLCGAMLSATRSAGVMIAFVLMIYRIMQYVREHGRFRLWDFIVENVKKKGMVIGTLMIPVGLFAYMYYLYHGLGDALAFVHIEEAWERAPFKTILHPKQTFLSGPYGMYMLVVVIAVIIVLIWEFIAWRRYEEIIFPIIIILMALPTSTQGFPRYMFGCFFIVLFCCDIIKTFNKPLRYGAAGLLFAYETLLTWMWLGGQWAVLC